MRAGRACAAAAAAVLALAGCGDELTGGEWVNEADAICTDATNRSAALIPPFTFDEILTDANERIAILTETRDRLEALPMPDDVDQAGFDAYMEELTFDTTVLERYKRTTRRNVDSTFLDVSAGQAATELGLAGCVTFADTIVQMQPARRPGDPD